MPPPGKFKKEVKVTTKDRPSLPTETVEAQNNITEIRKVEA
jgi:hypothetical protein